MKRTLTSGAWLVGAAGVLAVAVFGLAAVGRFRWAGATRTLLSRLEATRQPPSSTRYDVRELEGLPVPVQRYFRAVLQDGQRIVTAATVEHTGTFNLSQAAQNWKPFASHQRVLTIPPGFVWNARIAVVRGLAVFVHDAYLAGRGVLKPAAMGLFPLGDTPASDALDEGELIRFLAESVWYPTALLPSQGVRWEPVDDHAAKATVVDGRTRVTLLVRFNDAHLIESVRAEARGATTGNAIVMTPWEGRWSSYRGSHGMQVPFTGEAAWLPPGGRKPYWRGTIVSLTYEFAAE